MATINIDDWKAAFKEDLEARPGLAGVTVYDAEHPTADRDREFIILGDWTTNYRYISFTVQEEVSEVVCRITVIAPDSATSARSRGLAILEEVKSQVDIDPEASNSSWDTRLFGYTAEEGVNASNGRIIEIDFQIRVEYHE